MRYHAAFLSASLLLSASSGCSKKDSAADADAGFLQGASGEAKEALSSPVSFQLNEDNYAKWEVAERNLDRLPASEFTASQPSGGSAVDRAVARLQSSSRARRAIETAGLSVRDFVLETVALAQAVQASQTGRSTVASGVAAENFAFVERYRERIRQSGLEGDLARQSGDTEITDPETAAELEAARVERAADSISNAADSLSESLNSRPSVRRSRDSLRDTLRDSLTAPTIR